MSIPIGISHSLTVTVDKTNIASAMGSGLVDVFATPSMVALLEGAAAACVQPHLEEGFVTVGTHLNVSHSKATPLGMQVTATATVREVDRRRIEFDIVVRDERGEVGAGTHTRFAVNREKFTGE